MATVVKVTQEDVDELAAKLDEFGAVLEDREVAILSGVLEMAGRSIQQLVEDTQPTRPEPRHDDDTPSLSDAFRQAFQNGIGTKFTVEQDLDTENVRVKGDFSKAVA